MFGNLGRVRSSGVEVEAQGSVGALFARASYAFQQARDVESDVAPVNSPAHVARMGVSLGLLRDRARVSTELRVLGARRTVTGGEVPAYGLVNLTLLARPLGPGLQVSTSVYNLLDHAYGDPGGEELAQEVVQQDGRVVRIGMRYQF